MESPEPRFLVRVPRKVLEETKEFNKNISDNEILKSIKEGLLEENPLMTEENTSLEVGQWADETNWVKE